MLKISSQALVNKLPDDLRLNVLNHMHADRLAEAHERTQWRLGIHRAVRDFVEDGKIAFVTSGMDCDCSRWENRVYLMPAEIKQVLANVDAEFNDPEGASSIKIMRPSEARTLKESHRDLALEAFEEGHPHYITY